MVVRAASIWFTVDIVFCKIERIKLICSVISRYVSKIAVLCNLDCSSYALFNKLLGSFHRTESMFWNVL